MRLDENSILENLSDATESLMPQDTFSKIVSEIPPSQERTEIKMATKKGKVRKILTTAIAACLVVAAVAGGTYYYSDNIAADSTISIDVNPSVELITNKKDKIVQANAINSDGEVILDGMDLEGVSVTVAVNAVIGSMVQNGYITGSDTGILISVLNDDTDKASSVLAEVLADVSESLTSNEITASIINLSGTSDETAQEIADTYSISLGKAVFIAALCEKDSTLDAGELAGMTISELATLISEYGIDISDIANYDESDSIWEIVSSLLDVITSDEALEIALADANLSESDVIVTELKLDYDDQTLEYDIEFYTAENEYEYEINAITGEIISTDIDGSGTTTSSSYAEALSSSGTYITSTQAKAYALEDAGVDEADATFTEVKLDYDDGIYVYDIEFYTSDGDYEYEINATTGAVVSVDIEKYGSDSSSGTASSETTTSSSETTTSASETTTASGETTTSSSGYITASEARAIALEAAGVDEADATFTEVKLEYDDGVYEYEVEFYTDSAKYEYEINALTGEVISYEKKSTGASSTTSSSGTGYITLAEAKEIALAHAGLTGVTVTYTDAKLKSDSDDAYYKIEFIYGQYEYEYEIDASTGTILDYEKDYED